MMQNLVLPLFVSIAATALLADAPPNKPADGASMVTIEVTYATHGHLVTREFEAELAVDGSSFSRIVETSASSVEVAASNLQWIMNQLGYIRAGFDGSATAEQDKDAGAGRDPDVETSGPIHWTIGPDMLLYKHVDATADANAPPGFLEVGPNGEELRELDWIADDEAPTGEQTKEPDPDAETGGAEPGANALGMRDGMLRPVGQAAGRPPGKVPVGTMPGSSPIPPRYPTRHGPVNGSGRLKGTGGVKGPKGGGAGQ